MNTTAAQPRKRAYFVLPPGRWPGRNVYYYCPKCDHVFGYPKQAAAVCSGCGGKGCKDIFTEFDERIGSVWDFFDATLYRKGRWGRFRMGAADDESTYSLWAMINAMTLYGELRAAGFEPPRPVETDMWIDLMMEDVDPQTGLLRDPLRGYGSPIRAPEDPAYYLSRSFQSALRYRLFVPNIYRLSTKEIKAQDRMATREDALAFLEDPAWETEPWGKGAQTSHQLLSHEELLRREGREDDGMGEFVREWLERKQHPETGYWGGSRASMSHTVNGVMKLFTLYDPKNWPIPNMEKIVDTTLSLATPRGDWGSGSSGCSVFDPMFVLWVIRKRLPDYRADDIDAAAANCFLNFLDYWSEEEHFFLNRRGEAANWNGKHAMAIPLYMAQLILGQQYFITGSGLRNWRDDPLFGQREDVEC